MDLIQPLAAIVFVAALLGTVLFLLKKRGGSPSYGARRLEVIERVPLGPQHALHLVRAGDRLVLIATAPGSCQLLDHTLSQGAET
jgi:flagellar biogenesis protein FliO